MMSNGKEKTPLQIYKENLQDKIEAEEEANKAKAYRKMILPGDSTGAGADTLYLSPEQYSKYVLEQRKQPQQQSDQDALMDSLKQREQELKIEKLEDAIYPTSGTKGFEVDSLNQVLKELKIEKDRLELENTRLERTKKPTHQERIDHWLKKIDELPVIAKDGKYYFVDGKQADRQLYKRYLDRRHEYERNIRKIHSEAGSEKSEGKFKRRMKATTRPDGVYEWTTPDGAKGKSVSMGNQWMINSTYATTSDGRNVYMEEPPWNADINIKHDYRIRDPKTKDNSNIQAMNAFKKDMEAKGSEMKRLGMHDSEIKKELIRMIEEAGLSLEDLGY
tara:strand:- start:2281 stop:3279 length:999 start_codon:yes stop_codon:yes gene_type:complete